MNRNHLALFCAVADVGSITGAAQRFDCRVVRVDENTCGNAGKFYTATG